MNINTFKNATKGLRIAYQKYNFMNDEVTFNFWYEMLKNYDDKMLSQAVYRYIQTNEYPPVPANIIKQIERMTIPEDERNWSAERAWQLVEKAITMWHSSKQNEMTNYLKINDPLAYFLVKDKMYNLVNDAKYARDYSFSFKKEYDRIREEEKFEKTYTLCNKNCENEDRGKLIKKDKEELQKLREEQKQLKQAQLQPPQAQNDPWYDDYTPTPEEMAESNRRGREMFEKLLKNLAMGKISNEDEDEI